MYKMIFSDLYIVTGNYTHGSKVFPYKNISLNISYKTTYFHNIFMKFSALNAEINIVSLYNFQIIVFLLSQNLSALSNMTSKLKNPVLFVLLVAFMIIW